jgi:hypothetical protein
MVGGFARAVFEMSFGAFVPSRKPFAANDVLAIERKSVPLEPACVNGVVAVNVMPVWLLVPGQVA